MPATVLRISCGPGKLCGMKRCISVSVLEVDRDCVLGSKVIISDFRELCKNQRLPTMHHNLLRITVLLDTKCNHWHLIVSAVYPSVNP